MIAEYFPEICMLILNFTLVTRSDADLPIAYIANAAVFGFLIGGSENIQTLPLSEIIVASAIAGIGATRQANSHFKGSLGLGISPEALEAVLSVVEQVAAWNKTVLPGRIDIAELVQEVKANLQSTK